MIDFWKAEELLSYINPAGTSYNEWTEIGMAIKKGLGENGLELWDRWSQQDPERYKMGECEKKWKSFKESGSITEATLFYMAQQNGWQNISLKPQKKEPNQSPETFNNLNINNSTKKSVYNCKEDNQALIKALKDQNGTFKGLIDKAQDTLSKDTVGKRYLKKRGLSQKTINYFGIGSLQDYQYEFIDKNTGKIKSYALKNVILIPGSYEGYGIRNTSKKTNEKSKYLKVNSTVYPMALDIPVGLKQVVAEPNKRNSSNGYREPVFICEGYFDAPSFYEAGADAISLNGTGHIKPIIEAFEYFKVNRPVILALDNDNEGKKAQEDIFQKFKEAGIEVYQPENISDLYGVYKDANDYLTNEADLFKQAVATIKNLPSRSFDENLNYRKVKDFNDYINNSLKYPPISTGFPVLDSPDYLDGGLYPGLYIIGALSSAGKTTLVLQIADHIAANGIPVLYISLEMLAHELRAKSISRYTYDYVVANEFSDHYGKTVREILDKRRYQNYNDIEREILTDCGNQYFKDTGKNLMILEAESNIPMTVERIREYVKQFENEIGRPPVVFIDYLQLLDPPENEKHLLTDKQITDKNVKLLKQLSRDYNIPIVLISSFNRENYNQPVNMASFKESGGIEYSSDVLLGLENNYIITHPNFHLLKNSSEKNKAIEEAKQRAREKALLTGKRGVRLVILKNRSGKAGREINYQYYAMFNHYKEFTSEEWKEECQKEIKRARDELK